VDAGDKQPKDLRVGSLFVGAVFNRDVPTLSHAGILRPPDSDKHYVLLEYGGISIYDETCI
jgi:hypothetical protein